MHSTNLISLLLTQLEDAGLAPPANLMGFAEQKAAQIPIYYCEKEFHYQQAGGHFGRVPWYGFDTAIRAVGIELPKKEPHEFIEALRASIVKNNAVDSFLALAGHPIGRTTFRDGRRILVTKDFSMILPQPGDPTPLLEYLRGFLGNRQDQFDYVMSWLKVAVTDGLRCREVGVLKARLRPSQLLAIVGPPGAGKTLFVTLFSELFGGTIQNPYPAFSGATGFRGELAGSVFLVMDDSAESVRADARHKLAKNLKEFLVVPERRFEIKFQTAFSAPTFQRVIMLGNHDSLAGFPAPEPDFLDKYALIQAYNSESVSAIRSDEEREAWFDRYKNALPALVHYLLHEFEIPKYMIDSRYGVKAFQDKDLLAELSHSETDTELLRCLKDYYVVEAHRIESGTGFIRPSLANPGTECWCWEGFAKDFEALVRKLPIDQGWRGEFRNRHSSGILLRTLAQNYPKLVRRLTKVRGHNKWAVYLEAESTPRELSGLDEVQRRHDRIQGARGIQEEDD